MVYDALVNACAGKVPPALEEELRRTVDCLLDQLRSGEAPDVDSDVARLRADAARLGLILYDEGETQPARPSLVQATLRSSRMTSRRTSVA